MDGKPLKGSIDQSIEMYELCTLLKKTPSEIKSEEADDIALLLIVHNAKNSYQAEQEKKEKRKAGREKAKQLR